jgi:hypothetical protein
VNAHCRNCIYDPLASGRWREQVAACLSANCALFDVRPVPRDCMIDGRIHVPSVDAIRSKLDRSDRIRSRPE